MRPSFEKWLSAGVVAALVVQAALSAASYFNTFALAGSDERITHTLDVLEQFEEIDGRLAAAEAGQRGYLITGDERFLEPYNLADTTVYETLANLRQLTADNPNQQRRLDQLESLIIARLDYARQTIEARRAWGFEAAQAMVLTGQGKSLMDEIHRIVAEAKAEETTLLDEQTARAAAGARSAIAVIAAANVLALSTIALALTAISRELARRRRTEARLAYQARLLETVNDAIVASDEKYRLTEWNAAAESLYGWKAEEVIGQIGVELLRTEFPGVDAAEMRRQIAGTGRWRGEVTQLRKDGTRIPVEVSSLVIRDGQGRAAGYVSVNRDIAERRQAEEALQRQEALLRSVLQTLPVGVWFADEKGVIQAGNPAGQKIWAGARYVGVEQYGEYKGWWADTGKRIGPDEWALARAVSKGETSLDEVIDIECFDGSSKTILNSAVPLRDSEGKITGAIVVNQDITARRNAEKALQQVLAELRRSNDELEQFASVASHDLQEPLRMISSYLALLSNRYQGRLDPEADEFIGFAVDGARRMKNLIEDLLAYSRVGARGRQFESVKTAEVLAEVRLGLRQIIDEHMAVIVVGELPAVRADPAQLGQLFQNLIGNAIKFHGPRSPVVRVSAERFGTEWVFSVRDNGIGIAPDQHERIFDVFQRLHTRAEYPGAGIGLAICKRIVERHGGRIWVESKPGEGSTFFFTLPAHGGA